MERNLREDLEACNAATEGPWGASHDEWPGNANLRHWVSTHWDGLACAVSYEDARFIAEARDGWPHAIERAMDAEAEVERLRKLVRLMEPCVDYDKSSYGNYLWREVMGVLADEQRK